MQSCLFRGRVNQSKLGLSELPGTCERVSKGEGQRLGPRGGEGGKKEESLRFGYLKPLFL